MKCFSTTVAASALLFPLAYAGAQISPNPVSLTRAVAAAEARVGGIAFDAELERHGTIYEVELTKAGSLYRVTIDAATGRVLSATRPRAANMLPAWAGEEMPVTSRRTAPMLAALERATRGQVRELSFDDDDGAQHYEVELATAAGVTELRLDPATGRRMRVAYDD